MQADSAGRSHEVRVKHAFPRGPQMGFLAQDVAKVIPEAVQLGTDTSIAFMDQTALIPLLTQAMKEQQQLIKAQQTELASLKAQMERLEQRLNGCCQQGSNKTAPEVESLLTQPLEKALELPYLAQNKPNPTSGETIISYFVPSTASTAYMEIIDMQGKIVKTIPVTIGEGAYTLQANALQAGTYTYTLVLDNNRVAARKMVITN
jgi:hypothetical protein